MTASGPVLDTGLRASDFATAVRRVMGLPADVPLDPDSSLLDMGLDSLMAVELRTWARDAIGRDLPLAELLSGRPLREWSAGLERQDRANEAAAEPPSAAADRYPLAHGQRALWFIHQSAPHSAAYNVGIALRVKSPIDVRQLEAAFQAVVDCHPSLRARFPSVDGEPVQIVDPRRVLSLARHEASRWSDEELRTRVEKDYRAPFDLAGGAVLRVSLYTRSADEHVLLVTIHHIACDATSCWTVLEQVQRAYAGGGDGAALALESPSHTYAGHVEWQARMLDGDEGTRLWHYWQERLAGELPVLALPLDRPRPPMQTFRGRSIPVTLPPDLAGRLRGVARAHEATLFATLLAGFHALLHRFTGQPDVLVGTAAFARPASFDGVVGYFVNPLTIRADFAADPSFADLVGEVRGRVLEALAHQHLPFPLIVERLQPRRDPGRSPIFQADFSLSRPAPVLPPRVARPRSPRHRALRASRGRRTVRHRGAPAG